MAVPLGLPIRRVLLVEDDASWAALTREAFQDAAPEVVVEVVADGRAALARLAEGGTVDLVLLDLHLPDDGSLAVLGVLRDTDGPPVLAMSASVLARDREAVVELGAIDLHQKPVDYRTLVQLVGEIVGAG